MTFLQELLQNKILLAATISWAVAQVLKTIIYFILNRKFVAERMVGGGGMPSCHSATVCALATSTCISYGLGSVEFAITLILAIIVMYDAIGVRRETGIQAKVLNSMLETLAHMEDENINPEEKLKELIGHTPLQVLAGAILGILIAMLMCL